MQPTSSTPCVPKAGSPVQTAGVLQQPEMFPPAPPLILEIKGIPLPVSKDRKTPLLVPNCHIPSIKNCKMWITKTPQGRPLKRPLLISKPAYQEWREKAIRALESDLLSRCRITGEETHKALSRLCAILSQLPADDSVNDLPQGSWTVELVPPGQEGAVIEITRL